MASTPHNPGIILSITETPRWPFLCLFLPVPGGAFANRAATAIQWGRSWPLPAGNTDGMPRRAYCSDNASYDGVHGRE
jgi:hypothetical protein